MLAHLKIGINFNFVSHTLCASWNGACPKETKLLLYVIGCNVCIIYLSLHQLWMVINHAKHEHICSKKFIQSKVILVAFFMGPKCSLGPNAPYNLCSFFLMHRSKSFMASGTWQYYKKKIVLIPLSRWASHLLVWILKHLHQLPGPQFVTSLGQQILVFGLRIYLKV